MKNRTLTSLMLFLGLIGSGSTNLSAKPNQSIESITSDLEKHANALYQADRESTEVISDLGTFITSLLAISDMELPDDMGPLYNRSECISLRFAMKELIDFYPFRPSFLPINSIHNVHEVWSVLDPSVHQRLRAIPRDKEALLSKLKSERDRLIGMVPTGSTRVKKRYVGPPVGIVREMRFPDDISESKKDELMVDETPILFKHMQVEAAILLIELLQKLESKLLPKAKL